MNDRVDETTGMASKAIEKVQTRIAGLDTVLRGGLPKGRMTLLIGGPGTGKTNIALEFLYRNALAGEPALFVAFEERVDNIRANAASLGWDLAPLEAEGKLFLFEAHMDPQTVVSGDFTFQPLLAILEGQSKAIGARRIAIDAIDVPLRLFANPERERAELYALHDWLADNEMTSVLTAKTDERGSTRYEFLDYMANTLIWLDQRVERQTSTRRLRVIKYRGSAFDRNEYPYVIGDKGIALLPVTSARLTHKALGQPVSSGQPVLDRLLGGGFLRGSCVFIPGTSGTGKTLLAATFARGAFPRGERVLFVSFEESREALIGAVQNAGIDLRPAVESGTLKILARLPESKGAEEHLIDILAAVDLFDPAHVIIDAASSTERFRGEMASFDFLVRLINACKEHGRTCVLTNQLSQLGDPTRVTGLGVSSIVDTIVLLRHTDSGGEFIRTLAVLKSRGSNHSNQYREFRITDQGIEIPDVYGGEGGLVSGVARQEREAREAAESRRIEHQLHAKESVIAQLKAALEAQTAELSARIELAEADFEYMRLERDLRERSRQERSRMRGADGD